MATLILICGMAGAGKTTLAKQLETSRQAFRLCPDEWIKAVIKDEADKVELDRLRSPIEALQWEVAQRLLQLGISVILENGFWGKEEREKYRLEAKALGARVELYYLDFAKEEIWQRIEYRNSEPSGLSFRIAREEFDSWWNGFTPPDAQESHLYDRFWGVQETAKD
jgi:predicted kinase